MTTPVMATLICCHWKQDAGEARLKPLSHAGGKRNSYDEARSVLVAVERLGPITSGSGRSGAGASH